MTKSLNDLVNQLKWNKENKEEIKSLIEVRKCLEECEKMKGEVGEVDTKLYFVKSWEVKKNSW